MTKLQRELLAVLPLAPSDGKYLRGARLRVAEGLCAQGFARRVGRGGFAGAYYVRVAPPAAPGEEPAAR